MELSQLKATMDANQPLRHHYVFWCEDRSMADVYLRQMETQYGLTKCPRNTMAEAIREANAPSLFGGGNQLFVVRDDEAFAKDERGWQALMGVKNNYVVGIYAMDKKSAFANAVDAVRFTKIDKKVLAQFMVMPACGLDLGRATTLTEACDGLYGLCMLECDKVNNLAQAQGWATDRAFDVLMERGQLGIDQTNGTYQFVNSFVLGDDKGTFGALEVADTMGYLGLLYMQCKSMFLVQANANSKNLVADTGLTWNQINAYRYKRHTITIGALPKVMAWTQRVESGIKLGKVPMEFALRYLLAHVWGYASGTRV